VNVATAATKLKAGGKRQKGLTAQLTQGQDLWQAKATAKIALGRAALRTVNVMRDSWPIAVSRVVGWISLVVGGIGTYLLLREKSPIFDTEECLDVEFFVIAAKVRASITVPLYMNNPYRSCYSSFSPLPHRRPAQSWVIGYLVMLLPSGAQVRKKYAKLAQKLDQLRLFVAVFPQECMGRLGSFGPT
jgi:hypothetical protein